MAGAGGVGGVPQLPGDEQMLFVETAFFLAEDLKWDPGGLMHVPS